MADNVTTPATGVVVSTDDIAGVQVQRVKIQIGADGAASDVHSGNPLPISDAAGSITVDGTDLGVVGAAATDAAVSGNPVYIAGRGSTATPTAMSADGDVTPIWLDRNGRVNIADGAGTISIDDGAGSITVDGSVTADTELPAAAALADATANPTTPMVGSAVQIFNGTTWDRARGDTANGIDVDVTRVSGTVTVDSELPAAAALADGAANPTTPMAGAANLVYNGTTWDRARGDTANGIDVDVTRVGGNVTVVQTTASNLATLASQGASGSSAWIVQGETSHDSVDAGIPLKIGFQARSALPTAVASADRANGISDLWGRALVSHIDPGMQTWKSFNATTTQTGGVIWDPTAGKKIAITRIVVGTYGTTAARVILWFGDNADTTYTAGTDQLVFAGSFAPGASAKPGYVDNPTIPIFCTTADRELHITTDAAISIDVVVYGYEW